MKEAVRFSTNLDQEWAEALDYFHISWCYHPMNLKNRDGTLYLPDFFLPEQGAFLHILSEQSMMTLYDIEKYQKYSQELCVVSRAMGSFFVLGAEESDSYIGRCRQCGKYFFTSKSMKECPICGSRNVPLINFWISGDGRYGVLP